MASPTVWIFSAASSGMERSKASSISMTSSTVSSESAPRSFTKEDVLEIFSLATPSCLETISTTLVSISAVDAIAPPALGIPTGVPVMGGDYMDTLSAFQALTLERIALLVELQEHPEGVLGAQEGHPLAPGAHFGLVPA